MSDRNSEELLAKLESLGEDEVRRRLAAGVYGPRKKGRVEAWLDAKTADRVRSRDQQARKYRREEVVAAKQSAWANWATVALSGLALLVATAALIDSRRAMTAAESERLDISVAPDTGVPFARLVSDEGAGRIDSFWECLVVNAGNRGASIVALEITPVINPHDTVWSHQAILGGLFDGQRRALELPIFLEPGNSRRVFLHLGFRVDPATRDRLIAQFPDSMIPMIRRRTVQVLRLEFPTSIDTSRGIMRTFETTVFDSTLRVPEPSFGILFRTDRGGAYAVFTSRH